MVKNDAKIVHCRYSKCNKLHESTELKKEDAIQGGNSSKYYYHPDCYHTMSTVNEIRDTFIREINPLITKQQVGMLVGIINDIVFNKHFDVDELKFILNYFIKNKKGALKYPAGLHYAIQDKDAISAWKKIQDKKIAHKVSEYISSNDEFVLNLPEHNIVNNINKKTKFSSILKGG